MQQRTTKQQSSKAIEQQSLVQKYLTAGLLRYCATGLILLFTVCCLLSFAEALSDIKIDALQKEIKPAAKEKWGRDPFVRYENRISKEKFMKEDLFVDIKLDGIISDGKKALAIINGGFYRKGDRVNDFMIIGIEEDTVLLERNGELLPPLGINKFAIEDKPKKGGGK